MKLYMLKIGATPKGRLIEQHDIFFGIADDIKTLIPHFENAWQEIKDIWHLDCYRIVSKVGNYRIDVVNRQDYQPNNLHLYFINLGGYKAGHFEEYHHKMLVVADSLNQAISIAKQSEFYQEFDIAGTRGTSHIDDKYGVDIDEIHQVADVLLPAFKDKYALQITPCDDNIQDELVIGYLPKKMFKNA